MLKRRSSLPTLAPPSCTPFSSLKQCLLGKVRKGVALKAPILLIVAAFDFQSLSLLDSVIGINLKILNIALSGSEGFIKRRS